MTEPQLTGFKGQLILSGWNRAYQCRALQMTLLTIGTAYFLKHTLNLLSFTYLRLLHRSTLPRYVTNTNNPSQQSWALTTGSSDGIGLAFAEELLAHGVNIILHGRNPSKLSQTRTTLLAKHLSRQIRILTLDASSDLSNSSSLSAIAQQTSDIKLRILINNVAGGANPLWNPFTTRSSTDVTQTLNINTRFPTDLTRILLPQLITDSPSLIINIGSGASDFSCPYISTFAATKSYLQSWSRNLNLEMKAVGHDVEILHFQVGMVQTNASGTRATSWLVPSARDFARSGLGVIGCGKEIVWPWWAHAFQFGLIGLLPAWARNRAILGVAKGEMAEERANMREGDDLKTRQ